MTYLCTPLTAATCEEMLAQAAAARDAGAEMLELRLDHLADATVGNLHALMADVRALGLPTIATCRAASEGGRFSGPDRERIWMFEAAARAGLDFIDVERASWHESPELRERIDTWRHTHARTGGSRLILSAHDFERTPPDLVERFEEIARSGCDVPKIACRAASATDALRMLDLLRPPAAAPCGESSSPVCYAAESRCGIAIAMGEAGILTRVLAKKLGAFLTFASLEAGKESAPGQVTLHDMRELYRWDAIGERTKVYGVIGCPVGHSMSPAIHNAGFGAIGYDGVYLPMRVEPEYTSLAAFLDACLARPWLDVRGFSVTIPHKENLLRYVRERGGEVEPLAERIGVANTLVIAGAEGSGGAPPRLSAYNTDYVGALDALCAGLACTHDDLRNLPVVILGAGGASRAIVAGLHDCGARVTITNRTQTKAESLAREFGCTAVAWGERERLQADVIVNCTSIGMWPHVDDSPLPSSALDGRPAVFDTVYNPIETQLLRAARERGCRTIDGLGMLVRQAARQFTLWTGQDAPLEQMDVVARARLSH